jgi:hypothetical protein
MVLGIFGDGMAEGGFAEEDHAVETLVFDGADESFGGKGKGDITHSL